MPTECRGEEKYPIEDEFYSALHRLLMGRRNWRLTFQFRGHSTFTIGAMEWTKRVLIHFKESLKQVKLAFHFMTLSVLEVYSTLGAIYEEFLLPNKELAYHNKYPTVVVELLRIHTELCEFHKVKPFLQRILGVFTSGEQTDYEKEKVKAKKRSLVHISHQEQMINLNVTAEGELAAFLSFWLSRFFLRHGKEVIRPENLEEAIHLNYPSKANTIFPSHYALGWIIKLFPCVYYHRPYCDCPGYFPSLVCYAGLLGCKLSLPQVRHIIRILNGSHHKDSHNGRDMIDMGLLEEDFKFLLSIQSSIVPLRVGAELILEPFYLNDQGVPSNRLSFTRAM
ncbi:hypothetical protein Cgig2_020422 [Carnegiea gigantea]|uniref:Aminotransferase-like plant mobile domain-containing protein n=1 Tax=Carnegiea gigantea TaxID=171969 RepID=A0A9Q1JT23_9CARY|nr:hypothetical protein Cgig2_020422 [Carnegiea gigantea]